MEKYRPAIIAGGCAFALSLLIALVSGIGLPALALRPLIFGVGFFLFGSGVSLLFRRFLITGPGETGAMGSNVDVSVDDDDEDGLMMGGPDFSQDGEGLEQNTAASYTGDGDDIDGSFKPTDFNILNENADTDTLEEMPRPVDPPFAENRNVYARVPEANSVANADPKKLAGTIQSLLLDDE
jgi:hypothetical protein